MQRASDEVQFYPLIADGNAGRLFDAMRRIEQRAGLVVATDQGEVIAWLSQTQGIAGSTPHLHQHIGIDPCDDWSAHVLEYHLDGQVIRFPVSQHAHAADSLEPAIHAAGIEPGIGQCGANNLRGVRLHDDDAAFACFIDAQHDTSIIAAAHGHVLCAQDRHHESPSGPGDSPKVAEAGSAGHPPIPGAVHGPGGGAGA